MNRCKILCLLFLAMVFSACQAWESDPTQPVVATGEGNPAEFAPAETPGLEAAADVGQPSIANCRLFPANNTWNVRVDTLPIHLLSQAWIDNIGREEGFHMDFGAGEWDGGPIGIPYNVGSGSSVTKYAVEFYYPDESDAGPYPIPESPLMEYSSDHHILFVDRDDCKLYEIYDASFDRGQWSGGSGAV